MRRAPNPNVFLLLAAGTLVLGGGVVGLQMSSLSDQQNKVEALRMESQDPFEVQRKLDDSKLQLEQTSAKLSHLEQGISDAAYVPTLLAELEQVGKSNGIAVTGVRPAPKLPGLTGNKKNVPEQRKAYNELNLEVKGRGTYGSVMNFVNALQKFPKIVAARTVSLQPSTDRALQGTGELDVVIELRAYVFPGPATGNTNVPAVKPGSGV